MASGLNDFSLPWFGGPIWAKRLTSDLDEQSKQILNSISSRRQYEKGQTILTVDAVLDEIVVLEKGTAEIESAGSDAKRRMAVVGEVIGMTEILADVRYSSTLTATSDCEVKVIQREDLITFLRSTPEASYRSLEVISEKLETSRRRAFENV